MPQGDELPQRLPQNALARSVLWLRLRGLVSTLNAFKGGSIYSHFDPQPNADHQEQLQGEMGGSSHEGRQVGSKSNSQPSASSQ